MPVFAPVRSDLRRILLATPGLPPVAWEGVLFEPQADTPYLRESLVYTPSVTATLGNDGYTRETAIYNLTYRHPPGPGALTARDDMLDRLTYRFPIGSQVGSPTVYGRVTNVSRISAPPDPPWLEASLRITFFIYRKSLVEP